MRNVDRRGFLAGVASGDPTATGVVLWTRLAPRLFEPRGGMPDRKVTVDWQVASDDRFRRVLQSAPRDLNRWRMQYELYKSDPDLQAAHARFPWLVTWDDHEVAERLRAATPPQPAQLDLLDGRQYRSVPPCGWGEADACPEADDPSVTMLGFEQERWLYRGLARSGARWNLLGNNVMLARLDHDGAPGSRLWHDAWDGFPAARRRLVETWVRHEVRNPATGTPRSRTTSCATSTGRGRRWSRRRSWAPRSPATATTRCTGRTTGP